MKIELSLLFFLLFSRPSTHWCAACSSKGLLCSYLGGQGACGLFIIIYVTLYAIGAFQCSGRLVIINSKYMLEILREYYYVCSDYFVQNGSVFVSQDGGLTFEEVVLITTALSIVNPSLANKTSVRLNFSLFPDFRTAYSGWPFTHPAWRWKCWCLSQTPRSVHIYIPQ